MALALLRAWRTTSAGTKQGAAEGLGAGRTEPRRGRSWRRAPATQGTATGLSDGETGEVAGGDATSGLCSCRRRLAKEGHGRREGMRRSKEKGEEVLARGRQGEVERGRSMQEEEGRGRGAPLSLSLRRRNEGGGDRALRGNEEEEEMDRGRDAGGSWDPLPGDVCV